MTVDSPALSHREGSPLEVLRAFFRLGLTSFGGPIAHLGYFRTEFVERRRWITDERYAELIALCQFLPGPASSQVGFALGLQRAGWLGAFAAFVGFTLPSALLLIVFAALENSFQGAMAAAVTAGLKLAAVCVVAHAVLGMARQLTPDLQRAVLAVAICALMLWSRNPWMQLVAIGCGAVLGALLYRQARREPVQIASPGGQGAAVVCLLLYVLLLILAVTLAAGSSLLEIAAGFYRAGALVFGGGHVVLPLLEHVVVGPDRLTSDEFLAGYGAAQAIPGPMFSLSAYLGMKLGGIAGALMCLAAVFLPGFLVLAAALPYWNALRARPIAGAMLNGVNAAVVGIIAAALYDPVLINGVSDVLDALIAVLGFALLAWRRVSPFVVVALCVGAACVRAGAAG